MAFPASVNQVQLIRSRAGQPRPRRRLLPGEDELPDPFEPSAAIGIGGPVLDFGRLGGARLDKDVRRGRSKWRWSWIGEERPVLELEASQQPQLLFPSTRQRDRPTQHQSLEIMTESARRHVSEHIELFQHYIVPDVPDLIVNELATTYGHPGKPTYDPYQGHTLAVVHHLRAKFAKTLICFPMGKLGHQLNVAPLQPSSSASRSSRGATSFAPIAKPAVRFPTEILQICSSPVTSPRLDHDVTSLLIRLHSSTRLLNLISDPAYHPSSSGSPVNTLEVATLASAETEGRRHVDVALDPGTRGRALVIDEGGAVWMWWQNRLEAQERLVKTYKLKKLRDPVSGERDQFFRVAFGTRPGTAVVLSSKKISVIDTANPNHPETTLLESTGQGRIFTSLDKTAAARGATYTCVCTTYEMLWIDGCNVGPPILAWRHDYGGGRVRDLEVVIEETQTGECAILSSRSDPLIMVCHVSSTLPIRSLHPPYSVPIHIDKHLKPVTSLAAMVLAQSQTSHSGPTLLFGLDSACALWSIALRPKEVQRNEGSDDGFAIRATNHRKHLDLKVSWSTDVKGLLRGAGREDDVPEKARTRYRKVDYRWAWLSINEADEVQQSTAFSVSGLERHLRELDVPLEHFMTPADLARDAVLHDEEGVRSHLLKTLPFSPSALKTMLRELDQLDVSKNLRVVTKLGKNPASAFLSHHYQGSAHGGLDILEELQNTFPPPRARVQVIAQQDRRSSRSSITVLEDLQNSFSHARIQEQVNAHRLWLDLALSSTILFSEELNKTGEFLTQKTFEPVDGAVTPDDDFARATGLLSLNDHKAPPIAFSLLSPQPRVTFGDSDSSDQPLQVEGPDQRVQGETARSLMAEWIVGTDPRAFEWKGWRGNSTTEAANSYASRPIRPHPSSRITQIAFDPTPNQAKKLPFPARAAVSEPALLSKVPPIVQSSPPLDRPQQGTGYHEIGPSTQVEPGPYGGRPAGGAGKKKIKKRIGGF